MATPVTPVLGVVADDLTGAADIAGVLAREGVVTVLRVGEPNDDAGAPDAEGIVVGLKIRTAPVASAIEQATASADWLQRAGVRRFVWKICSTFDSTAEGNIGPVADALLDLLGERMTLVCPAFPANGRTVVDGRLFVHGVPLDQSPMRDHPLTPMRDADLARLLGPQVRDPERIVRLPAAAVEAGAEAVTAVLADLRAGGARYVIADAANDRDCDVLGAASAELDLVTCASGLAAGIVRGLRDARLLGPAAPLHAPAPVDGPALVIAGSCSTATREQVARYAPLAPSVRLDPLAADPASDAIRAARTALATGADAVMVHSTDTPLAVEGVRTRLGADVGAMVERALAETARALVTDGVRRVVIAGGETTGAVLDALEVADLRIGPELAPGVPIVEAPGPPRLVIVPKSGNFGGPDLFAEAVAATGTGVRARAAR
ncbi:MAG: 3-oxo-tetronate kinase [Chloroflexota bacterium]